MSDSEVDFVDTQAPTQVDLQEENEEEGLDPLTQSMLEDEAEDDLIDTQAPTQVDDPKSKTV